MIEKRCRDKDFVGFEMAKRRVGLTQPFLANDQII